MDEELVGPVEAAAAHPVEEISDSKPETGLAKLRQIADEIKRGDKPQKATVRTLLDWFGYQRRGPYVVSFIEENLKSLRLTTDPDFRSVWLDAEILFAEDTNSTAAKSGQAIEDEAPSQSSSFDPTYRLRRLRAANNPPVWVRPQQPVKEALTIMMANDFS